MTDSVTSDCLKRLDALGKQRLALAEAKKKIMDGVRMRASSVAPSHIVAVDASVSGGALQLDTPLVITSAAARAPPSAYPAQTAAAAVSKSAAVSLALPRSAESAHSTAMATPKRTSILGLPTAALDVTSDSLSAPLPEPSLPLSLLSTASSIGVGAVFVFPLSLRRLVLLGLRPGNFICLSSHC